MPGAEGITYVQDGDHALEQHIPIAICGMAIRVAGGVASPQEFWDFLINKGDGRIRVPESRYKVENFHRTDKRPGAVASEYGYFLDESVPLFAFDSSRFSLSRAELEFADPQQRRLLEIVREAFDDAGDVKFRGKRIGVYFGNMCEDWGEMLNRDPLTHGPNKIDGYNDWMLSNRISYEFGLKGPSMTIRTACSSALIGLNEACAAMQRGVCEGAIVAGTTMMLAPGITQSMTEKGILGPDGSCKTFSADANGYARGEAVTAVYIKPLDAAIRDGNPIRAVIRAAMSNSDGKTQGITQPNPLAHEAMIRRAYQVAGIDDVSQTAYFECHGTGTAVGDPIETSAVANIFGDKGIHITSVKPNVGHTEGASGIVSLIKAVMSLENRTIPPNIKFNIPNPKIPFKERKLTVPVEPTPFPAEKAERVSVNSFGLGGSNAHVIVDSAKSFNLPQPSREGRVEDVPQLLLYSASSTPSLKAMTAQYEEYLAKHPEMADKLDDLAYTLANRREHLSHRAFKVVGGTEAPASAGKKIPSQAQNLVMVFTGQGAQWPRMGRELLQREDLVFSQTMKTLDGYLQELPNAPKWTIEGELNKPTKTSQVNKAELSQPLCTAVQVGLVDLYKTLGIEPAAVVGHSSGELGAAYAAGALTAQEAIVGAYQRGQAAKLQERKGAMAAVGLGWNEVERFLNPPKCVVACENSPKSVTLSGDADAVAEVVAKIKEEFPDITARLLKVEKAYHSYHMQEIGDEYCKSIEPYLSGKAPVKPFFSSVTGAGEPETKVLGAKYWQQNLESAVRFNPAVAGILKHIKNPAFLEVGPHGALAGPARQIFAANSASPPYVSAMVRNEDCVESYLKSVGQLFELNIPIDYEVLTPGGVTLPGLPRYPWNHTGEALWFESRMSKEFRNPKFPKHPLLGRAQLECTSLEPSFRNLLNLDDAAWLRDHKIQGSVIFPAAGYCAMAGEAVRQLSGIEESYSLRHVKLSQAFILQDGVDHEVVTNLRPVSEGSEWWDFTVASYSGSSWVKHCVGQVSAGPSKPAQATNDEPLPRKLETKKTFDTLAKAGMQYGPAFQLLDQITAGTVDPKAQSTLTTSLNGDESFFHLHPTVIDAALQAGLLAVRYGKINASNCAAMPTTLEQMTIYKTAPEASMRVNATTIPKSGEFFGHFQVIADGQVVLDMPEGYFTPLEDSSSEAKHNLPITGRVSWLPHLDFMDAATLIKPDAARKEWTPVLDELAKTLIVLIQRHIESGNVSNSPIIQHFVSWVGHQHKALGKDFSASALDDEALVNQAQSLGERLTGSPFAAVADGLLEVGVNIADLLSGKKEIMQHLTEAGLADKIFENVNAIDRSTYIKNVAHSRLNLRVLEIGASTSGSTAAILKDLTLPSGTAFSKYTYTTVDAADLAEAKKRFQDTANVDFRTLDISRDPAEQGLENVEYDLIVAVNSIHATESLSQSLSNVRKLLAADGALWLQEMDSSSKWANCIFGLDEQWWSGVNDGRTDEPYVKPARWEAELKAAGFSKVNTAFDAEQPYQTNAVYIAKSEVTAAKPVNKTVTVLADAGVKSVETFSKQLQSRGYKVEHRQLGDELTTGQDIISLLDETAPFFEKTTEARFEAFKKLLNNLGESALFWITRPSQMYCNDPKYAQIIGASRSIRNEEILDFATCEVDDLSSSMDTVIDVFAHFQARPADEVFNANYEWTVAKGGVYVPRIYPFTFKQETLSAPSADTRAVLEAEKSGRASQKWITRTVKELTGSQVEVQVYASGVTSKAGSDVPVHQGSSGVVSRVGPQVKDLAVGDRVISLDAGSFSSYITTSAALVEKIPKSLSFEDAATLPASYVTASWALYNIGNLEAGQSVLIHNAGEGVGLAAVQLAKSTGAEIYATAATEEQTQYLKSTLGLAQDRVFSSTSTSFVEGVKRGTAGQGVDLVISSLSSELSQATWKLVAEFGKFVDVGAGQLQLKSMTGGRSYASISLESLIAKKPASLKKLLQSTLQLVKDGKVATLTPHSFDGSNTEEAFKQTQEGQYSGKVVLSIRDAEGNLKIGSTPIAAADEFKADGSASYLLAGGLGGIGTVIARHLVERGARRLVCLSRNPGAKPEDADTIKELKSMGCEIVLVKGNMVKKEDILNAVRQSPNLKGVLHAPMLLQDESFRNMSLEQWNKASDPKVQGAWHLHNVLLEENIKVDFFVFLSSISGAMGQPGQANYAGANTFLDAFAQYRNNMGLAASSIDIGAVADVGYAARDEHLLSQLLVYGNSGVTESEMIQAFSASASYPATVWDINEGRLPFAHQNTYIIGFASLVSLKSPESRSFWKRDPRMGVWHNIAEGASDKGGEDANGLKSFLAKVKGDTEALRAPETSSYLALEIGKQLMNLLLKSEDDLDVTLPVSQLGLDSLVGIEMRTWWRQTFGSDISVLQLLGLGTLEGLGKQAVEQLLKQAEA